ncbi:MAG: hypothetical protein OSA99_02060 [Acidimicrobiales bacterium]|nr:hypothetical protein [Acidimicrobiales bacterium]
MRRIVRLAALAAVGLVLVGVGAVVGDVLADDSGTATPARSTIESAPPADGSGPGITVVSGNTTPGDGIDGADLDLAAFGETEGGGELPDGYEPADAPGDRGPTLDEELIEEFYEPPPLDGAPDPGDPAAPAPASPVPERPDGVPALDPAVYDLSTPRILGFDDPCALVVGDACPRGIPAEVLGSDPTVPLRLGSVAQLGTLPHHGDMCESGWNQAVDAEGETDPIVTFAASTNLTVDLTITLSAPVDKTGNGSTRPVDADTARFAAAIRGDDRVPSDGPGAMLTCVSISVPDKPTFVAGTAAVTSDDGQTDSLDFELRLAGGDRDHPIVFQPRDDFPVPTGATGFQLFVPQSAPDEEVVVTGIVPIEEERGCASFDDDLATVSTAPVPRRSDTGGQPIALSGPLSELGRLSPYVTFETRPGILDRGEDLDPFRTTYRGYLPAASEFRVCVWWFDISPSGDRHVIADGAPSDATTLVVRSGADLSSGIFVTGITTHQDRPPGFYNLYLVKPGLAAICLPRKRPDPFPVAPAETPLAATDDDPSDGAVAESPPAFIPAGHHRFGPGQPQAHVRICEPKARSPFAIPFVKAGPGIHVPSSPPIPLNPSPVPLPADLATPLGVTYPIVAPDGAILELTVITPAHVRIADQWRTGEETPIPPAPTRSSLEVVRADASAGDAPGQVVLDVGLSENVGAIARLIAPTSAFEEADGPCTTAGAATEVVSDEVGSDHRFVFDGLCAGAGYEFELDITDGDGALTTRTVADYTAPPNLALFDVEVEVEETEGETVRLHVADIQFIRQPGVVSLSSRVRLTDLFDTCLTHGDVATGRLGTAFGHETEIRVRFEGTAGCDTDAGRTVRIDSSVVLPASRLTGSDPFVFEATDHLGHAFRVTLTPR